MRVTADTFRVPKAGNTGAEYEDDAAVTRPSAGPFRAAVADGATEASFAGLWAGLLVRAYRVGWFDRHPIPGGLDRLRARWQKRVGGRPLPWYAEQKLAAGAFAALVGLTVTDDGQWRAMAVGDCNLFHVRGGELAVSFPLTAADQFGSRPTLISTDPASNQGLDVRTAGGEWRTGDEFYLMSDALACWFLRKWEARADPLDLLRAIAAADQFVGFVDDQRHDVDRNPARLKNDDVTMVRCGVG